MSVACPCQTSGRRYQVAVAVYVPIMKQGQSAAMLIALTISLIPGKALARASYHSLSRSEVGMGVTGP